MAGKRWNAEHASELLDEHPQAYKDIDQVMEAQSDLVTVEAVLHQVFNYKGHK
jgi:tRNA-splicing ligase RtcB